MSKVFHRERTIVDYQLGWIRQLLIEPHRDPKKRGPFKVQELLLFPESNLQTKKHQTPEQQLAYVEKIVHPYFIQLFGEGGNNN